MEAVREKPKSKKPKKKITSIKSEENVLIEPPVKAEKENVNLSEAEPEMKKVLDKTLEENVSDPNPVSAIKTDRGDSFEDNVKCTENNAPRLVAEKAAIVSYPHLEASKSSISLEKNAVVNYPNVDLARESNSETSSTEQELLRAKLSMLSKFEELVEPKPIVCHVTPEKVSANNVHVKRLYPNMKTIERLESIESVKALVQTHTDKCLSATHSDALRSYQEFMEHLSFSMEGLPLFDLVKDYQMSRKRSSEDRSQIKSLNSKVKRHRSSLWKQVEKSTQCAGKCEDGNAVVITRKYKIVELDEEKLKEILGFTRKLSEAILSDGFNSYLDQVSNMKIEQNMYNLVQHLNNFNLYSKDPSKRNFDIEILRKCISILFCFQRSYTRDKEFLAKCRKWLSHLVFVLLQNSPLKSDYTFIVNHVIRCPNGIKTWASQLVQSPRFTCSKEEREKYACKCLYYSLLLLYLIVHPAYDREDFLKNLKECKSENEDASFIFLDSEGEEEDIFEPIKEWTSDDIISLLVQVPLDGMYEHVIMEHKDGALVRITPTEDNILKMFGFSNALLNTLFSGLSYHHKEKLSPVVNHICIMIRKVINYVTVHWESSSVNFQENSALQAEYDRFVFHSIFHLSGFQKFGVWNHLSALPYRNVSKKMQWHILWIFHAQYVSEEGEIYNTKDVDTKLQDSSTYKYFVEKMKLLDTSDQMYLLHVYKAMALCENSEENLISFIIEEIYKLAFVESSLGHLTEYSTAVLVSIIEKYPKLVTALFRIVQKQEDQVIDFSKNLFHKLILFDWVPTAEDIREISDCILSNPLSSPINYLARELIKKMNFEFSQNGDLFLPLILHQEVAVLVLQAYMRFDSNANKWSVSKGLNQMLQLNKIVFSKSEDDGFVAWAWTILFSLKLHVLDQQYPVWVQIFDGALDYELPDPFEQLWLQPLLKGYEENHPAACYIFLVMTNVGHNVKKILAEGIKCLTTLVECQQFTAAIHALYYILPFCVKQLEELLSQTKFIELVSILLTFDMDILPTGSGEAVVGNVLHEMAAMIKHQIFQASAITVECAAPLMTLWLNLLLKVLLVLEAKSSKLKDFTKQAHFLLDVVVKIASVDSYTRNKMVDLLHEFGNPLCAPSPSSEPSFFRKWFGHNTETLTILRKLTLPDYPWLAWFILRSETKQKHVQEIWNSVQKMVAKEAVTPYAALKKSCSNLKLAEPLLESLPLYRWAKQILETDVNHAALPLLYQQFFYYFFDRIILPGTQKPVSVGLEYFNRNPNLLTQLRKHAQNASEFYREQLQCPKDSESGTNSGGSTPCGKKTSSEEMALSAELCRVFRAFYVWIDDKNLHLPNLCLTALDPKYYAHRLNCILNKDQNDWLELVSICRLKEELNAKIHSYCLPRSPSVSSQGSSDSEVGDVVEPEPLDINTPKHVEPLDYNIDIEPSVLHIDDSILSNPNALLKLIEEKQTVIFEKARAYAQIESKLKKVNEDYKILAPDEYIIQDQMVTEFKSCYKGANCAGPAKFNLEIQKHHTNQKVETKLEALYAQQRALQEQLINLPVSELCHASVTIDSYIRALAKKLESSSGEEAITYRNAGICIFYRQIQSLNRVIMSVKSFSPSRSFFATSIESLGNVFIRDQEDQLNDLAQAILNYPEAGELAFNLFNPNIASFPVFQDVYYSITNFIRSRSPNAIFVLLKKVDMDFILKTKGPSFNDRRNLFQKICQTLLQCGPNPPEDLEMIFHILRRHYCSVLNYMFPELYEDAVSFLLDGMETGKLAIPLWYVTFKCLGCPALEETSDVSAIQTAFRKVSDNMLLPPHQQIFVSSQPVNVMEVQLTLRRVYEKFLSKRKTVNLYRTYKAHFKAFGIFIGLLSHSMLSLLNDFSEASNNLQQMLNISDLWKHLQNAFHPWIHPEIEMQHLKFPWEDDQINDARLMCQIFSVCLTNFHEKLLNYNCEKCILSFVWDFYVEAYVLPDFRHYAVEVFHSEMLNLPWNQFYPDSKDIEGMCSVLQSSLIESKEFLSKISYKIPWIEVMKGISVTRPPEYIRKYLSIMAKLLIVSSKFDKVNPSLKNSKAVEDFCWYYLSLEDIESLLDLYFTNTDPNLLLNEEQANSSDAFIVQFLKIICCMTESSYTLQNTHTATKRLLYLHKLMEAFSSCTLPSNLEKLKTEKFQWILPSLLTDIDRIISKGCKPNQQMSSALPLVREVIGFLNNVSEAQLEMSLVQSVVTWLESNPHSPLLLPCLQTACQCLTHMTCTVRIVESCIVVRFKTELNDSKDAQLIWEMIHSSFLIPKSMTDEFVTACIRKNALLALYCHVEVRMKGASGEDKKLLLFSLIDWVKRCKIADSDETKSLLLWDRILELATSLALEGYQQVVKMALKSFCSEISKLGEDKSSYYSIIFGQPLNYSVNFRFLCRITSAFLHYQLPNNASVRLQPLSPGYVPFGDNQLPDPTFKPGPSDPTPSEEARKAVESCKALLKNSHYSALHEILKSALTYVLDPRNCMVDSKGFLKNYALDVFPKCPYLYALSAYSVG